MRPFFVPFGLGQTPLPLRRPPTVSCLPFPWSGTVMRRILSEIRRAGNGLPAEKREAGPDAGRKAGYLVQLFTVKTGSEIKM